ncbi:uncharacterized protein LOC135085497 [Ostrinia nubilalis]
MRHRQDDNTGWGDKKQMIAISIEMIKEAQMRIRQIRGIIKMHDDRMAFDVGVVLGNIRERYRRMFETYRQFNDKHTMRSEFHPPSIDLMRVAYYIVAMQLVHEIELDIDKLIHVLETIDNEDFNPDPRYDTVTSTRRPGIKMIARAREEEEEIQQMADEQALKRKMRERHLMRRLNLERQHTTAKRFEGQWPVEGNWELGAYGDMGLYAGHQ